MADKQLSQSEWKSASKGTAWKADPLTKALAAFEKADKSDDAAETLSALADVEKQADVLAKAHKGDKALSGYLGELDKAVTRRRAELQKAQAEAAKKGGDEEEEADDVLLDPKRLLAQLSLLKRDPAKRLNFAVVDASDKRPATFALSGKIAGRKLFAKLQDVAEVKLGSFGLAWLVEQTLVLQVENKPMGGLTKKIRTPIRDCGFKVGKVVLWDASGAVLEESAEDGPEAMGAAEGKEPERKEPEPAGDPQQLRFEQRLGEISPRVQAALAGSHPAAAKLREVLAFANDKAGGGAFPAALQALEALAGLLGAAAPAAAAAQAAPAAPAAPAAEGNAYARSGRAWSITRSKVAADVARLRDAILAEYKGSPMLAEVSTKVRRLDAMVARFDDGLDKLLEQASAAADDAERTRLHKEASAAIRAMLGRLDSDPILSRLKDNPFLPIDPRTALNATLQVLAKQVA